MRAIAFGVTLLLALTALGQSGVGVEVDDVTDNRVNAGMFTGSLELRVKLTGNNLDKATAARVLVKEAKDDRGTSLSDGKSQPDFFPREYNSGTLQVSVSQPARAASSVRVKGTVELLVPARDPNAQVKIDKALSKLDAPFANKTLKAAKLTITPLSKAGYAELMKSRKLDDKKIEEIRARAKKENIPEAEVEMMIGLAKAMEGLDDTPAEGAVILSAKEADFKRVYRVEILGSDGKPMNVTSRSTSTRGDDSIMILQPSEAPPANAALEFTLVTDKARLSFPFDLKVQLP